MSLSLTHTHRAAHPEAEELTPEARVAYKKEQGNASFKAGDFQQAAVLYTEALLINDKDHALFSNRAAAFLKLGQAQKALEDADACVGLKEDFVKGHFRRAVALIALDRFQQAGEALALTLRLDPNNKEAAASMQMLQAKAAALAPLANLNTSSTVPLAEAPAWARARAQARGMLPSPGPGDAVCASGFGVE
eukprot:CAMPEP_0181303596 /NCGR_PEP_ID=MMETSP1101-20121128/8650_1 /TAXON_ID=46948 /ORGANISM="Rhodomonas abbreviata, Strain Caron Lab Isolate" /LENGTH=191 /DNA_ID=CAMNT_0023409195 /DNA_START=116 /DNA_END=692 /DNA_ORIENTATION=+